MKKTGISRLEIFRTGVALACAIAILGTGSIALPSLATAETEIPPNVTMRTANPMMSSSTSVFVITASAAIATATSTAYGSRVSRNGSRRRRTQSGVWLMPDVLRDRFVGNDARGGGILRRHGDGRVGRGRCGHRVPPVRLGGERRQASERGYRVGAGVGRERGDVRAKGDYVMTATPSMYALILSLTLAANASAVTTKWW